MSGYSHENVSALTPWSQHEVSDLTLRARGLTIDLSRMCVKGSEAAIDCPPSAGVVEENLAPGANLL
jgi:hypothetical protein